MANKIRSLVVRGIEVYLETDSEGYTSISTDGYLASDEAFKKFLNHIKSYQVDDDLEYQDFLNKKDLGLR
jgi:hypothetical protein